MKSNVVSIDVSPLRTSSWTKFELDGIKNDRVEMELLIVCRVGLDPRIFCAAVSGDSTSSSMDLDKVLAIKLLSRSDCPSKKCFERHC